MCMFLREREREKWGHNGGEVCVLLCLGSKGRQAEKE